MYFRGVESFEGVILVRTRACIQSKRDQSENIVTLRILTVDGDGTWPAPDIEDSVVWLYVWNEECRRVFCCAARMRIHDRGVVAMGIDSSTRIQVLESTAYLKYFTPLGLQ